VDIGLMIESVCLSSSIDEFHQGHSRWRHWSWYVLPITTIHSFIDTVWVCHTLALSTKQTSFSSMIVAYAQLMYDCEPLR